MRGKDRRMERGNTPFGITPAYAGKSSDLCHCDTRVSDHPRLCGEKQNALLSGFACQGSPPPMRGKVKEALNEVKFNRITPAYAGKSRTNGLADLSAKDHPRLCGEKFRDSTIITSFLGSPPPMRGKV